MSTLLLNGETIDAVPCALYHARRVDHSRLLARHRWLLRRKYDGRYLACAEDLQAESWRAFGRLGRSEASALRRFLADEAFRPGKVPGRHTRRMLDRLGIDPAGYAERTGLTWEDEPTTLRFAGLDRFDRPLWLSAQAASAWQLMVEAAQLDNIELEAISGFRSHAYQLGIFSRKLARRQTLEQILSVNAAPGFSEHHSGEAIDIGTPGEPAAEESFENTPAFAWLGQHAARFGFRLSYPRGNPHGIAYEPWHWRLVGKPGASRQMNP